MSTEAEPIRVQIVPPKTDPKRVLLSLGITLGTVAALVAIQRKASGPDSFVFIRNRFLAGIADAADGQARLWGDAARTQERFWHGISDAASRLYLSSHP